MNGGRPDWNRYHDVDIGNGLRELIEKCWAQENSSRPIMRDVCRFLGRDGFSQPDILHLAGRPLAITATPFGSTSTFYQNAEGIIYELHQLASSFEVTERPVCTGAKAHTPLAATSWEDTNRGLQVRSS